MHQLLLTEHWRRVCSSHCPAMTSRLKLGWSVLPQFSREAVSSSEVQFREMKFWVLCLQKMLWWLYISSCFHSSFQALKRALLYCQRTCMGAVVPERCLEVWQQVAVP